MALRKQILWSDKFNKFVGYCDFGGELQLEGLDVPATEALVFMLVSLNGRWKLPIAYILQNKISAIAQAELVKTVLDHTYQAGITVWGITCDGAYTNSARMKILGCDTGNNYNDIKCWFPHPVNNDKIYFIPDACHNLKLARNTLGNCRVLKSNSGFVRWEHISCLHNLQQVIQLKFGNKISGSHIKWHNNKMKVKYAAQTLSSSTANALHFLKQNISEFLNCDVTEEYCRVIDHLFDFLNYKSIFSKNFKSPIHIKTIDSLEKKIVPLITYLYTLEFDNKPLSKTNKKTFIIGFAVAVKSLFSIARSVFANDTLKFDYILTYKFSQDHLELLFGQIRQRGGSNNNPNIVQFKTAMKQILLKNAIKCKNNGNCNTFDDDAICNIFDFKWNTKRVEFTDEDENSDVYDLDISDRLQQLNNLYPNLQNAKENILYYILEYVVRKVSRTLDYQTCKDSLLKKKHRSQL